MLIRRLEELGQHWFIIREFLTSRSEVPKVNRNNMSAIRAWDAQNWSHILFGGGGNRSHLFSLPHWGEKKITPEHSMWGKQYEEMRWEMWQRISSMKHVCRFEDFIRRRLCQELNTFSYIPYYQAMSFSWALQSSVWVNWEMFYWKLKLTKFWMSARVGKQRRVMQHWRRFERKNDCGYQRNYG